ncbi:HNH endonuclease [Thermoactinomyces sp. CICC 10521]|nr:HNH endonuclease [Thermoactinomyces sp. CICC 10521]
MNRESFGVFNLFPSVKDKQVCIEQAEVISFSDDEGLIQLVKSRAHGTIRHTGGRQIWRGKTLIITK